VPPFSLRNTPVGPSPGRVTWRAMWAPPSSALRWPAWLFRSVAQNPGDSALTLIPGAAQGLR